MIKFIDRISEATGKLSAWIFLSIGLIVCYEVFMRRFFTPTVWVDEVARIAQIWAAYLAGAFTLKHREMIVIDVAFRDSKSVSRKLVETFSLFAIVLFCSVTVWYGFGIWLKETLAGHTTDSYLGTPKWLSHASIWVGFGLLGLQAIAETVKIWTIGIPADDDTSGGH